MGKLLFSPSGRIGQASFMKGAVTLLIVNLVLWQAWHISLGIGILAFLLSFILIYCWGCLFAKRFHDAGKSGWFYLPIFLVFVIITYVFGSVLLGMLSPEIVEKSQEVQDLAREVQGQSNPDFGVVFGLYNEIMRAMVLPFSAAYLITGTALALAINALLSSDLEDNQFGPPPALKH